MQVTNKKAQQALEQLNNISELYVYDLRTDNEQPHLTSKKYHLYAPVSNGYGKTNSFGAYVESFNTIKEFLEYVEERINN